MRIRTAGAIAGGAAAAAATSVATYPVLWRRWCLTWGATAGEAAAQMPGDDLMASPDLISTRAITVEAPPSAIWPWLVQMGSGRGGAYTYDWIENLFGLGMHSANEILPQFQDLKVGDVLSLGSENAPRLRVAVVDLERALVVRSATASRCPAGRRLPGWAGPSSWSPAASSWNARCCLGSSTGPSA